MALNAASHNPTAEPTGSVSGPPPPVPDDLADAVQASTEKDSTGQTSGGQDEHSNDEGQTVMGRAGKEKIAEEDQGGTKDPH